MTVDRYRFEAELWLSSVEGTWVFLTVPPELSDEILELAPRKGGFGSVRVEVAIGETTWRTSLFPDTARASYVLPVKRAVRNAEGIDVGDRVPVNLRLVGPPDHGAPRVGPVPPPTR